MNCIYAYIKKNDNKVVYVGKTNNINERRRHHEKVDPYCPTVKEYNYPLSRGIRKYGETAYKCIILENNIPDDEAGEREIYWINYYNTYLDPTCYNLTEGGEGHRYVEYSKETIELAKKMIKKGIPFKEISQKLNMPIVNLSEINTGKRHHDSQEKYPLYELTQNRKLNQIQIEQLQIDLQNGMPISELENKYKISKNYISMINNGKRHNNPNLSYPLHVYRIQKITDDIVINIVNDLQFSTLSYKEIEKKYGVSDISIRKINSGERHRLNNFIYPIRN